MLRDPIYLRDEEEEDSKQGGYVEFMIPKSNKEKEKVKEEDAELIYIAPIKHDHRWVVIVMRHALALPLTACPLAAERACDCFSVHPSFSVAIS